MNNGRGERANSHMTTSKTTTKTWLDHSDIEDQDDVIKMIQTRYNPVGMIKNGKNRHHVALKKGVNSRSDAYL